MLISSPIVKDKPNGQRIPTGLDELYRSYHILKSRRQVPEYALDNKTLWRSRTPFDANITALSPHSRVFEAAIASILDQLPEQGTPVRPLSPSKPNLTSIVLWLEIEGIRILLAADMEESTQYSGWSLIVGDNRSRNGKADVYKVAHHGSETGEHNQIWTNLLVNNPHCLIAPYRKGGNSLPAPTDLQRIGNKSNSVHLTCVEPRSVKRKRTRQEHRERSMDRIKAKPLYSPMGQIRCRRVIGADNWTIEYFGNATKVP